MINGAENSLNGSVVKKVNFENDSQKNRTNDKDVGKGNPGAKIAVDKNSKTEKNIANGEIRKIPNEVPKATLKKTVKLVGVVARTNGELQNEPNKIVDDKAAPDSGEKSSKDTSKPKDLQDVPLESVVIDSGNVEGRRVSEPQKASETKPDSDQKAEIPKDESADKVVQNAPVKKPLAKQPTKFDVRRRSSAFSKKSLPPKKPKPTPERFLELCKKGSWTLVEKLLVELLKEDRVDLECADSDTKYGPIMYAVKAGKADIVDKMIQYGFDVNRKDKVRRTQPYFLKSYCQ